MTSLARTVPNITIEVIPHNWQAYNTAGNYFAVDGGAAIFVSQLPDWRYEALIAVHEFIEMLLTTHDKISWKDVTDWDTIGAGKDSDDPGAMPDAPYHTQHMRAEQVEKQVAEWLDVDWAEYNAALDALEYK